MNTLMTVVVALIMIMMSIVPLFVFMYVSNDRSRLGVVTLAAALCGGALLGMTFAE